MHLGKNFLGIWIWRKILPLNGLNIAKRSIYLSILFYSIIFYPFYLSYLFYSILFYLSIYLRGSQHKLIRGTACLATMPCAAGKICRTTRALSRLCISWKATSWARFPTNGYTQAEYGMYSEGACDLRAKARNIFYRILVLCTPKLNRVLSSHLPGNPG